MYAMLTIKMATRISSGMVGSRFIFRCTFDPRVIFVSLARSGSLSEFFQPFRSELKFDFVRKNLKNFKRIQKFNFKKFTKFFKLSSCIVFSVAHLFCLTRRLIAARRNTMTRNINLYHPAFYDLETAKHSGGIWNCCTSQNSHLVPPDTTKKHCLRPYQDTATVSLTVKNKSPDLDGNQTLRTNRCSPNKQQRKSRTGGSSSARRASLPKPGPRKVAEPKETKGIPTATADLKCFWMKPEMELKPFISQTTGAATFAPAVVSMQKGDSCLQNPPGLQSNWNQPTSDSSQTLFSTYRENFALRSVYPCFPQYFSTPYSLPAPLPNWPWPGSCAQTPVLIALPKSNLRVQCLRNNRPNGSNLFPRDYRRRTVISPAQHSFFRPFYPSPPNIVAPYLSGRFPPQPFQNRSSNFSHQWHRPLGHESPFPQVVRSPQLFQPTFVSKKDGDFNRPQYLPGEFHGNWQPAQSYDQTNLDPAKNSRPPKGPLELRQSAKDPGPSFGDVDHNQLRMGSTTDINPAGSETDSVAAPAPPGNREALYIFTPGEANPFHPTIVLTESTWVRFGARLQVYGLVNPERTTLCCELDYLPGGLCNENYIPKRTEMIKNLMSTVHEFYFDEEQIEKVTLAEAAIVRLLSAGFCSIDQFWKTLEKTLRAVERKYDQRLDFPDPQTEDHKSARPFFSYVTVGKKGQKCPHSKAVADGQSGIACYVRSGAMVKRRGTRRKYRLPCPKFLASSRK